MKCSPEQIRHLTLDPLSLSFMLWALGSFSSFWASCFQLAEGRKMMFSPTEVVSPAGPAGSLADRPNLGHCLRWATRGLTTSRWVMRRMRRVVLTVWPLSLRW